MREWFRLKCKTYKHYHSNGSKFNYVVITIWHAEKYVRQSIMQFVFCDLFAQNHNEKVTLYLLAMLQKEPQSSVNSLDGIVCNI